MAAPTFQIAETNTSSATVSVVTQTAFASVDQASSSSLSASYPIAQGNNSFEKWSRVQVVSVATTTISALSVYFPGSAVTDSGGSSSNVTLKFGVNASFSTPTASTSTVATTLATSASTAPGTTVTAPANTVNAYSGYVTEQLQTNSSAAGGPCVFSSPYRAFQYTWS